MGLSDRIKERISGQILPFRSGMVINSYYGSGTQNSAFVDVIIGADDEVPKTEGKVPLMKSGGVSTSLPPVGSTVILAYLDNNESKPFVIGYLDSDLTSRFVKDDKMPRRPPTHLTR